MRGPENPDPRREPSPLPQRGYAWAVWSACRLSPAMLAQVARAAAWQISEYDDGTQCFIDVTVAGDVERFRSGKEFREEATPQAQRRFSQIKISVRGSDYGLDITVAREPTEQLPWDEVPSVVLAVGAAKDDCKPQVKAIRQGVAAAIDRGTFSFFHDEPKCGEDAGKVHSELKQRVAKRRKSVGVLYFASALLPIVLVAVVAKILYAPLYAPLMSASVAVIASMAYNLASVFGNDESTATWRRRADAVFFPAVEVAELTPGRRALRLLLRLLTLAVAPLLGALAKELIK